MPNMPTISLYTLPILSTLKPPELSRAETIPKIESGELEYIEFPAQVFRLDGKNRNHFAFRAEDLPAFATSFKDQPFLRDHSDYRIEDREGIIPASRLDEKHIIQTIRITTRKGMLSFIEGQIDRFSVGFRPEWIMCSICKADWSTCLHWPGRKYKTESGEETCQMVMIKPIGKETSAVNNPAMDGTGLLHELKEFKKHMSAKGALIQKPKPTHQGAKMDDEEEVITEPVLQVAPDDVLDAPKLAAENRAILAQNCRTLLDTSLAAAALPKPSTARLRSHFEQRIKDGQLFGFADALASAIEDKKGELAELNTTNPGPAIQGPGRTGQIHGMFSGGEEFQAAFYDLMEAGRPDELAKIKPARLNGIQDAYLRATGDYGMRGGYYPDMVYLATSVDFPNLLANVMNKIIAEQWQLLEIYRWWEDIVKFQHYDSLNDIKGVIISALGLLPTVVEQGEYPELAMADSGETAAFVKKGGYIPITIEVIDKNQTYKLREYPRLLADTTLRTRSSRIAEIFTQNSGAGPTMSDTGALFNAVAASTLGGHQNLRTTAFGTTEWRVIVNAMRNQPLLNATLGGGPKQGIGPRFCLYPMDATIEEAVLNAFQNEWAITDNKHTKNILRGTAVPIPVPEWTDTNNFAAVADPDLLPCIVYGERFGDKPEIYTANDQSNSAALFMFDEIRIKARDFAAILVQNHRGLHKNNVA